MVTSSLTRCLLLATGFIMGFSSCKKNDPPINGGDEKQLYSYSVTPATVGTGINGFTNEHLVYYDTRVASKNKLVVFLPGTTGFPGAYTEFSKRAAALGYHSIGLMYPNSTDLYTTAAVSTDLTLFGKARQEIFTGQDLASGIQVDTNNCIRARLHRLLSYLSVQYPNQNWRQYLSGNDINWGAVIITGHSQGGGHALYIAKKVPVYRAVSFCSMDWNTVLGTHASWVYEAGQTPADRLYTMNHNGDEIFDFADVQTQMGILGIPGTYTDIQQTGTPFGNSHRLYTRISSGLSVLFPNHNVSILDAYIPRVSGAPNPLIVTVWDYLIGIN
ncbi:MAG: BPSS1187 family protein [Ferruginibacter sp.]